MDTTFAAKWSFLETFNVPMRPQTFLDLASTLEQTLQVNTSSCTSNSEKIPARRPARNFYKLPLSRNHWVHLFIFPHHPVGVVALRASSFQWKGRIQQRRQVAIAELHTKSERWFVWCHGNTRMVTPNPQVRFDFFLPEHMARIFSPYDARNSFIADVVQKAY